MSNFNRAIGWKFRKHSSKRVRTTISSVLALCLPPGRLLVRSNQLAMAPRKTKSGIDGQCHSDPDENWASVIPGSKPPSRALIRKSQFAGREKSKKENDCDDLPGGFLLTQPL